MAIYNAIKSRGELIQSSRRGRNNCRTNRKKRRSVGQSCRQAQWLFIRMHIPRIHRHHEKHSEPKIETLSDKSDECDDDDLLLMTGKDLRRRQDAPIRNSSTLLGRFEHKPRVDGNSLGKHDLLSELEAKDAVSSISKKTFSRGRAGSPEEIVHRRESRLMGSSSCNQSSSFHDTLPKYNLSESSLLSSPSNTSGNSTNLRPSARSPTEKKKLNADNHVKKTKVKSKALRDLQRVEENKKNTGFLSHLMR